MTYKKVGTQFLAENPYCWHCAFWGRHEKATQIHHIFGRMGELLTDTRFFFPCCFQFHHEIEATGKIADHNYLIFELMVKHYGERWVDWVLESVPREKLGRFTTWLGMPRM